MRRLLFTLALLISITSFGQNELEYEERLMELNDIAHQKYKARDYFSATADYNKITELYDSNIESGYQFYISNAWFYLGLIKMNEDDGCPNAIINFNKAIEIYPSNIAAYNSRATARVCVGDFQGAINDCEAVIKLDPLFVSAYDQMIYSKAMLNLDYCNDYKTALGLELELPDRGIDFKQCN